MQGRNKFGRHLVNTFHFRKFFCDMAFAFQNDMAFAFQQDGS